MITKSLSVFISFQLNSLADCKETWNINSQDINRIFLFIILVAKLICLAKNTKTLNLDDLRYLLHRWSQCFQILQRMRFKGEMPVKKIQAHLSSLWQEYDHLKMRKNDMKFFYEKGPLRETIKLVGSSIDRQVCVPRLRKTMLRISYAHIVSHYHIIWVIRSLFRSFQS